MQSTVPGILEIQHGSQVLLRRKLTFIIIYKVPISLLLCIYAIDNDQNYLVMPSYQPNDLPLPRRIVVSNRPLPASLAEKEGVEGSVEVTCADVSREILMDGAAGRLRVGTHEILPTSNAGLYVARAIFFYTREILLT